MDAPPSLEPLGPFLYLAEKLRDLGLLTPEIFAKNMEEGFLLLEDFGNTSYFDLLDAENVDRLYGEAFESLLRLAGASKGGLKDLPVFDRALLLRELGIFETWCLESSLGLRLTSAERRLLDETFEFLAASALSQPQILVHRDFHSRNLMARPFGPPGILDFQDAVQGPITYDIVSLLRDCYIDWPTARVKHWVKQFHARLSLEGLLSPDPGIDQFQRWFDLMGTQRHLKAIGIFTRLHLRDGKSGYLKDIPRTLRYVLEVAHDFPELQAFAHFLEKKVAPAFPEESLK